MILTDLHMHTTYCDGRNTPEEMVLAAIGMGMKCIGFSEHSHVAFDSGGGMAEEDIQEYCSDVASLREKYRGIIDIRCGIEKDFYSLQDTSSFDYVIGSVHYVKKDGIYISIDETSELLEKGVKEHYAGDIYSLAEDYYDNVAHVVEQTGADIIGHFDLITKYIESGAELDTDDPRYTSAWQYAADRLVKCGKPFEINTGAIARGWRSAPYPDIRIIEYIREHGGSFVLSSDSHSTDTIAFGFDRYEYLL